MDRKQLSILTIFLGSMLLFGVQPMVGRTLLPFFGGTSAVWVVCLCTFQVLLLGGYFYAHRLSASGRSLKVHLALLAISACWAFAVASLRGGLDGLVAGLHPALGVMLFLTLVIGLPYLALSANSSLVQSLASGGERDVYWLYAVSNAGSLVGLFLYPFILEPFVSVGTQWRLLGLGIALYAILLFKLTQGTKHQAQSTKHQGELSTLNSKLSTSFLWLLLPAISCAVLNAVTAHLTLDVIALPLLWCLLLALFLLSYVIGFSSLGGRLATVWDALAVVSAGILAVTVNETGASGFTLHLVGGGGLVLFGCTALHVRLYAARPGARELTRYYLFGAVGGAVGGILTSLVAPLVFTSILEFPLSVLAALLVISALRPWRRWRTQLAFPLGALAVVTAFVWLGHLESEKHLEKTIHRDRGFFGTLCVDSSKAIAGKTEGEMHLFTHGSTLQGSQFLAPGYGLKPTVYYTPHGGGLAILRHPKYRRGEPMRVGIIGMGMGISCAYGRSNDVYRCWEISPEVADIATNRAYFTYIADCPAKVDVVMGDARLMLEKERAENAPKYDVIQIDAFSGDSVPYHLSTKEAFQLYFDRLAPGGFLSVHISNWHIDLVPMIKAVSHEFDAPALVYAPSHPDLAGGESKSIWGLILKEVPRGFSLPPGVKHLDMRPIRDWPLPSDDKGSLISLLRVED